MCGACGERPNEKLAGGQDVPLDRDRGRARVVARADRARHRDESFDPGRGAGRPVDPPRRECVRLPGAADSSGGVETTTGFVPSEVAAFGHAMRNSLVDHDRGDGRVAGVRGHGRYAFSRLKFAGRRIMFGSLVATLIVPALAVIVPLWRVMANLHLIGSQDGLLLIYISANAPLAVWLMYIHARELPIEVEEAARADGCSRFQAFRLVCCRSCGAASPPLPRSWRCRSGGSSSSRCCSLRPPRRSRRRCLITEFVGQVHDEPTVAGGGRAS